MIRIYVAQTLMLGLAGGLLGVVVGVAVAAAFPGFIARYFQIDAAGVLGSRGPRCRASRSACLTTLLFTVPPLLGSATSGPR